MPPANARATPSNWSSRGRGKVPSWAQLAQPLGKDPREGVSNFSAGISRDFLCPRFWVSICMANFMEGVFPGIEKNNPTRGLCFCMSVFFFRGRALISERREPRFEHFFAFIIVWVRFYRCIYMTFCCSTVSTKARTRSLKGICLLSKHLSFARPGPCFELRLTSFIFVLVV